MISGLHFLLTYECTRECPHCFVWGSPEANEAFTINQLLACLEEASKAGIEAVAFEGGEPFLEHEALCVGVREAHARGMGVTVVTNGFWASSPPVARAKLEVLAALGLQELMISSDDYHGGAEEKQCALNAHEAAQELGLVSYIAVTELDDVLFRGRAARKLADEVTKEPNWQRFTQCESENLAEPGRVHIDALGNVMVCQGICIGSTGQERLASILTDYEPHQLHIVSTLLNGGPAALAAEAQLTDGSFADACHLCFEARAALRPRYPDELAPPHVYGC